MAITSAQLAQQKANYASMAVRVLPHDSSTLLKENKNHQNKHYVHMKKTLQTIIDNAYKQWQEGIVKSHIPTINERTIQVYLAYYLLQYGKPIAEKAGYDFQVLLEKDMGEINACKIKGHARCSHN